jgi:hypothetical protein
VRWIIKSQRRHRAQSFCPELKWTRRNSIRPQLQGSLKSVVAAKENVWSSERLFESWCRLEGDLCPQNHDAARVFGSVLPVQIVAIADIVHSRVKWPDIVMVTDVLNLSTQDQLTALQVEIGSTGRFEFPAIKSVSTSSTIMKYGRPCRQNASQRSVTIGWLPSRHLRYKRTWRHQ